MQKTRNTFDKWFIIISFKKEKLNVKVVNKDIVLFKAIDEGKSYSESGIINRKSGELVHEITKDIKSDNSEKDISFYSVLKRRKKSDFFI